MSRFSRLLSLVGVLFFTAFCYAEGITVAFYAGYMNVLGSHVALFDYADFNEQILGNKSIIIMRSGSSNPQFPQDFDPSAVQKFVNRFGDRIFYCDNPLERDCVLLEHDVDILYMIKFGNDDGILTSVCKNAVHAMYPHSMEKHGDAYAAVSDWVSNQHPEMNVPVVPHIVRLHETKENFRKEWGIPEKSVVFGRHGSLYGFDLDFAKQGVINVALQHKDWYFVFLFTDKFCHLPNVIFLPVSADMEYKTKFINTCDAMIHARNWGETFGLSCAEFSLQNKPVITCDYRDIPYFCRGHIEILGDRGFYYRNQESCVAHLTWIGENIEKVRASDWDCCSKKYNPEIVIKRFEEVFITPLIGRSI